jgi:hypothetical protein
MDTHGLAHTFKALVFRERWLLPHKQCLHSQQKVVPLDQLEGNTSQITEDQKHCAPDDALEPAVICSTVDVGE